MQGRGRRAALSSLVRPFIQGSNGNCGNNRLCGAPDRGPDISREPGPGCAASPASAPSQHFNAAISFFSDQTRQRRAPACTGVEWPHRWSAVVAPRAGSAGAWNRRSATKAGRCRDGSPVAARDSQPPHRAGSQSYALKQADWTAPAIRHVPISEAGTHPNTRISTTSSSVIDHASARCATANCSLVPSLSRSCSGRRIPYDHPRRRF